VSTRVGPAGVVALAVATLLAVVLQGSVLARLPLPGGAPNLVLVLVLAVALTAGASAGLGTGFAAGLLVDLGSVHPVGVLGLCFGLAGFAAGLAAPDAGRSVLRPMVVVAAATAGAYLAYLGILALIDRPAAGGLADLPTIVLYDVMLTPFVLPVVAAATRWLDPDARR